MTTVLAVCMILLLTVQDIGPTQQTFGRTAGIATYALTPLMLVAIWAARGGRIIPRAAQTIMRTWWIWLGLTAVVSAIASIWIGPTKGETALGKSAKLTVAFALFIGTMAVGAGIARNVRTTTLRRGVTACLALNLALLVAYSLGFRNGPLGNDASVWHLGAAFSSRPRLLTSEASTAGALLILLIGMLVLLSSRPRHWVPWVLVSIPLVYILASRGAVYTLVAAAFLTVLTVPVLTNRRMTSVGSVTVFAALVALVVAAPTLILHAGAGDPYEQQSNTTRAAYAQAALVALEEAPLGGTFAGSLTLSQAWVQRAISDIQTEAPAESFGEISSVLVAGSAEFFSPKTLPAYITYQSGFVGLLLLCGTCWYLLTRSRREGVPVAARSFFAAWLLVIASFTFVDGITTPEVPLLMGMLMVLPVLGTSAAATSERPLPTLADAPMQSRPAVLSKR